MCGVFGIFGHENGKLITKTGTWAQQHRGQDACGLACLRITGPRQGLVEVEKGMGKVRTIFSGPEFDDLQGDAWISHVRYSTQGKPSRRNAQPHYAQSIHGKIAIVSNGDVVNMAEQRAFLDRHSIRTYTENDAELIAASINYQVTLRGRDVIEAVGQVMDHVRGAFSSLVVAEFDDRLFAFRDPHGIRPLFMATVEDDGAMYTMFASETAAFAAAMPLFGPLAEIETREVGAGEVIAVGPGGIESFQVRPAGREALCLFEIIYFSRPDSFVRGKSFQTYRMDAGMRLFREHPAEVDLVSPIPKSGIPAAMGYAQESDSPFVSAVIENPSFDIDFQQLRTFIESTEQERLLTAQLKFNCISDVVRNRDLAIIDDSIVRGLVTRVVNTSLWRSGARRIHTRIASPPYRYPCFYGIETKQRSTLAAATRSEEEVRRVIAEPTSLAYLSLEGLVESTGLSKCDLCTACFDGDYPVAIGNGTD
ncbi:MAG: amidophosphoribosyltransferase [Candidatus Eisenbacteria bacterium]